MYKKYGYSGFNKLEQLAIRDYDDWLDDRQSEEDDSLIDWNEIEDSQNKNLLGC